MNNKINYETYLFISSKQLIISVNTDLDENIYQEKLKFEDDIKKINYQKLDYFLEKNIFKIEKKIKNFVKKISIILDLDIFFPIEIAVKKKNYENNIDLNNLNHILYDAKDYCKKTIDRKKIVHMIINNYRFDDENHSTFPEGTRCNNLYLDIEFICLSLNTIKNLEEILKKYQISLHQVVSAKYVESFLSNNSKDLFLMAKKIINGYNPNEVKLVDKTSKNQGFFEKFFNFFN